MASPTDFGLFLPTTYLFEGIKGNEEELFRNLYRNINSIILALNQKDTGIYPLSEFVNGQSFFANPSLSSTTGETPYLRPVFRIVVNFGALPNAGTKTVAHGITVDGNTTFTRIYGTASDTTGNNYIPLPYASPTDANNIELSVDGTNVTVITGSNRSAFDTTYVVLEFLKQ